MSKICMIEKTDNNGPENEGLPVSRGIKYFVLGGGKKNAQS